MIIFLILFRTPQNLDFAIPYTVFEGFSHPKSSHFGIPFRSLFRYHFGTPFGRAFWPTLAPKVPTLPPHVDFGTFLGPPWGPKWDLGAPMGGQGGQKGWSPELGSRSRLGLGRALCANGVPKAILIDFGTPLGDQGPLFRTPLGEQGAHSGPPLGVIRLVLKLPG